MFLDAFDSIKILNLPHRTDRKREMTSELRRMGLGDDPRVVFMSAISRDGPGPFNSVGAHGCFLSHLAALEEAASSDQRVLILEDDCEFTAGARRFELPGNWDIFYGGYLADNPEDPGASNIIGAQCMGYSARAARAAVEYLRAFLDPSFPPDLTAAADPEFDPAIKPPFDGAIVWFRRAHPQLKTVFAQIAIQRSSRSDIAGGRLLDKAAPKLVATARKAKNALRRLAKESRSRDAGEASPQ